MPARGERRIKVALGLPTEGNWAFEGTTAYGKAVRVLTPLIDLADRIGSAGRVEPSDLEEFEILLQTARDEWQRYVARGGGSGPDEEGVARGMRTYLNSLEGQLKAEQRRRGIREK